MIAIDVLFVPDLFWHYKACGVVSVHSLYFYNVLICLNYLV